MSSHNYISGWSVSALSEEGRCRAGQFRMGLDKHCGWKEDFPWFASMGRIFTGGAESLRMWKMGHQSASVGREIHNVEGFGGEGDGPLGIVAHACNPSRTGLHSRQVVPDQV